MSHRMTLAGATALAIIGLVSLRAFAADPDARSAAPRARAAAPREQDAESAEPAAKPQSLSAIRKKASYALGLNMGKNLRKQDIDLDIQMLSDGIKDALSDKAQLTDDEIDKTMQAFEAAVSAQQADKNKKFLTDNKSKEGVKATKTGLQYKVLKDGNGEKPKVGDHVLCHYRGRLISGDEFDSSYARGKPASFELGKVIAGWNEALPMMAVGSKWRLFIPSDLAYGEPGYPPLIGPNATLVFDIELLGINEPEDAPKGGAQGRTETRPSSRFEAEEAPKAAAKSSRPRAAE